MENPFLPGLDPRVPKDNVSISTLPSHIRTAKLAAHKLVAVDAVFEEGTQLGDLVYPDERTQMWMRTRAGVQGKDCFYGVAFPSTSSVVVGPGVLCDNWAFTPGAKLYLGDLPGTLTTEANGNLAAIAITGNYIFLNSLGGDFSSYISELRAAIAAQVAQAQTSHEAAIASLRAVDAIAEGVAQNVELIEKYRTDYLDDVLEFRSELASTKAELNTIAEKASATALLVAEDAKLAGASAAESAKNAQICLDIAKEVGDAIAKVQHLEQKLKGLRDHFVVISVEEDTEDAYRLRFQSKVKTIITPNLLCNCAGGVVPEEPEVEEPEVPEEPDVPTPEPEIPELPTPDYSDSYYLQDGDLYVVENAGTLSAGIVADELVITVDPTMGIEYYLIDGQLYVSYKEVA